MLNNIPDWLGTALIGAAIAFIGYVGKSIWEAWQEKRKERAGLVAQLQKMDSLLKASKALFVLQQSQVKKLMEMLREHHSREFAGNEGYDDTMARCYQVMNEKERELHGIIRAYTEHSLRKVNQAMSDWLSEDKAFKAAIVSCTRRRELADELFALEIHLTLWHAKYESWIPGHPEHALVYLDDEKEHGLGFPNKRFIRSPKKSDESIQVLGVDVEVSSALAELQEKWK